MRYFVQIAYNGTNYHGWQIQPSVDTVQERINYVLSNLQRETIMCTGCGRTDAGVHASNFYLHFDTHQPLVENMVFRMNRFLPKDIVVQKIFPVADNNHTRFNATYRAYDYYIHFQKNPFKENLSYNYWFGDKLNFERMQEAFDFLQTIEDFATFQKKNETKTSLCQIFKTELIIKYPETLQIHIAANRFLRGMIRLIVGALLMVGEEKLDIDTYKKLVQAKSTLPYNRSAPACGLYLSEVRYPFALIE